MKLDAWLRQEHTLAERLLFVERLSQALNAVHDRGEILAALEPARVDVGTDMQCDLSAAQRGTPDLGYAAPERAGDGPPSTAADVYAAGAICWEVLAGRPCGEPPRPLPDVAPDLPRELASAVMGCLERSPQWRPKDLTYLAQLAAAHQKVARRGSEAGEPAPPPPRATASQSPRAAASPRPPARRTSRSHLPLLIGALLVVAAAAGSYWWMRRQAAEGSGSSAAVFPTTSATPTPAATPSPTAEPAGSASPEASGAAPSAAPQPEPAATPTPGASPTPTPPPARPEALPTPTPAPRPAPTPTPTPPPVAAAPVSDTTAPEPPAAPREPAVLTAISPLSIRRPGRALLDLRGTGFHPELRARVVPLRGALRGIAVARQKWVSDTLVTVLLELDETVVPGAYSIALEDPTGVTTKSLPFTVTK